MPISEIVIYILLPVMGAQLGLLLVLFTRLTRVETKLSMLFTLTHKRKDDDR